MYKKRLIHNKLDHLFNHFPVIVLSGARQVGKTTLLTHLYPSIPLVTFDPVMDIQGAKADPQLFLDNNTSPIILDEIQYALELVPIIKRYVDKNDQIPGQYLITGSQQWNIMKSLSESLAGRCAIFDLFPFSLIESANAVDETQSWVITWLENFDRAGQLSGNSLAHLPSLEQIWRGFLPKALSLPINAISTFHQSYMQTYVERDVRVYSDIGDLQQFRRFYQLVTALTAQEINFSQLGRELGFTPQTAQRWLEILKATYQWFELSAYSGNTIKRISGKPKGYFFDSGLACHSLYISSHKALVSHPQWGALFESAVACEIRKQLTTSQNTVGLYHWRAHSGAEVDILLEKDGMFFPIEIKAKTHITKKDARGIHAFKETYPKLSVAPGLIVYLGQDLYQVDRNIYAMPWDLKFELANDQVRKNI